MGLMSIFSRKQARPGRVTFGGLPRAERLRVVRRILSAKGYAGFNVVGGDQNLRARATVERGGEDSALSYYARTRLFNLARQGVRNSEVLNTILKQFQLNVVGTVGGKASFILPGGDEAKASAARAAFARYCRSLEYFDGFSLGELLKKALVTYIIGGDMVLYHDPLTRRVIAFEPDCINNVSEADFAANWPAGWTQRQGRVYNECSQFCGVICSHSQRGMDTFKVRDESGKLAVFFLRRDPCGDPLDCDWVMVRNAYRFNQGRGTPPIGASLGSIIDLEDVTKYEVQAAKHNAQTIGQIYQTGSDGNEAPLTDGLEQTAATDWNAADEEAVKQAVEDAQEDGDDYTFDNIKGAGVIFNKMPAHAKMELLDTKHPNANMPEFIRWLAGRSAASLGLGSVYATMKADASYTAFRGEQVMSWPAFEELQKYLENTVCDWVLAHWARTAPEAAALPDGWRHGVRWSWPKMREVNQVDEQTAIEKKLKNFTGSYEEIYGPDWRNKLAQVAEEVRTVKALGIPHPGFVTVSGAEITGAQE